MGPSARSSTGVTTNRAIATTRRFEPQHVNDLTRAGSTISTDDGNGAVNGGRRGLQTRLDEKVWWKWRIGQPRR